jgi:hypothetical protein
LRAVSAVQFAGRYRDDVTVAQADVPHPRRRPGAVEPTAVRDDRVVRHHVIEQGTSTGVNDIDEQILITVYFWL